MKRRVANGSRVRGWLVQAALYAGLALLGGRAAYLQVVAADYLQTQGEARHTRVITDHAHRGMVLDRNGVPLAVSTPVDSVWAHPATALEARAQLPALARLLGLEPPALERLLARSRAREFVYLKRHVPPALAARVTALEVPGVALLREYRRYYPSGAVTGHVIGFTNIDDRGQEGLELAYDDWLRSVPGAKRVLKDLHGNAIEVVESIRLPEPGRDLATSLDRRIQYLAYRELKAAVEASGAAAGAAVVLDAWSGEVLALVNEPDFNPNNRAHLNSERFRNRAVTDLYEPGSTLKPFTIAAALASGRFTPQTPVDTAPGVLRLGGETIHDLRNHGRISVAQVIEKSSNVGASRIALALGAQPIADMLVRAGFADPPGSRLPGEVGGLLRPPSSWVPIEQATISYGYGVSVTVLQLARAYAALANGGELPRVTLVRRDVAPERARVMAPGIARAVTAMLEAAVDQGTGGGARVPDYRVAGKTGTVHKLTPAGYAEDEYVAWFAGFAPVAHPRLVMVVAIDGPRRGRHFGGQVAAPVFGRVMSGALRLLDIPPDAPRLPGAHFASAARSPRP